MRFDLAGADPLAVRLAIAGCRSPLRVERSAGRVAIVVAAEDAQSVRPRWLRAGLAPRPEPPWPGALPLRRGVLEAGGLRRRIARLPVDAAPREGEVYLLLVPIAPGDALRALAGSLDGRLRSPFHRGPRRTARIAAAILSAREGVAAARAYEVASGAATFSSTRAARLRGAALAAWQEIGAPSGGVWRSLTALQRWWQPRA
jgi:hypothetical protein